MTFFQIFWSIFAALWVSMGVTSAVAFVVMCIEDKTDGSLSRKDAPLWFMILFAIVLIIFGLISLGMVIAFVRSDCKRKDA